MSEVQSVVNVAVPFSFDGQHYKGFSLHNGVSLSEKPFPCGVGKVSFAFENCTDNTESLWIDNMGFTGVEVSDTANPQYLQLMPAV